MDVPVKISPRHPCHAHRDIGCGQSPSFGFCVIVRIQSRINADVYRGLIALIRDIFISGCGDKKFIGKPGIVRYLPEIVRENALYLAIFCIRIGIPGRVAQDVKGIVLGILGDDALFFFRILQIFGISAFVIFAIEGRFPVALGGIHLIDCIIYLVQKLGISFFDDHIKITAAEFFKDALVVYPAQGTGDNGIDRSVLKGLCHLLSRIEINRCVGKAFGLCILCKFSIPGVSVQECNTHPIVGTVLPLNDSSIIAANRQDIVAGSDGTGKIKQFFAVRRFAGRSDHVDLAVQQHLLHILPAFVIADVLIVCIPIARHQAEEIIAVTAAVSILIHHVIAVHRKKANAHALMLAFRLFRTRRERQQRR